MKRVKTFLILLSTLYPLLLSSSAVSAAEPGQLAENQARIGQVDGDVGLLSQGATEWIEPREGLPLEPGDQIRTAEDSRVELCMTDNAVWVLQPESVAVAERVDDHSGRLNLVQGSLLGKLDSARAGFNQQWEFNTPAAVAAVRGTEFAIAFSPKDGTRLGVFEGKVLMQAAETAAGESPLTEVPQGQEALVKRGQALPVLARLGPAMRAFNEQRGDLRKRVLRVQQGWSIWTPADRSALRKQAVSAPPKPHPKKPRALKLRGDLKKKRGRS